MTWNYRVMVRDGRYAIYSVYYEDGRITSCSVDPMYLDGESLEELAGELERFGQALLKPVLEYETMEAEFAQSREADI
jgi:hypothetical protein